MGNTTVVIEGNRLQACFPIVEASNENTNDDLVPTADLRSLGGGADKRHSWRTSASADGSHWPEPDRGDGPVCDRRSRAIRNWRDWPNGNGRHDGHAAVYSAAINASDYTPTF